MVNAAESISLQLAAVETPAVTVNRSRRFAEFGRAHSFFAELQALVKRSPTQGSITKTRAALTAGQGFNDSEDQKLATFLKTALFVNGKKSTRRFLKGIAKDKADFGGYCFQVIWAADRKSIQSLHYQRFRTVASGEMDENEVVSTYFLCRNWAERTKNGGIKEIPAFDPKNPVGTQLYYHADPSGDIEYYPLPDYEPAFDWIKCEGLLGQFHVGNVDNNFSLGNIMVVADPQPYTTPDGKVVTTAMQRKQFALDFKKNFSGPGAEKVMLLFAAPGTDPDKLAKLTTVSANNNDDLYSTYNALCREQILAANRVPSPGVVGVPGGASLGGDGNTLRVAFELYFNTVCRPDQVDILEGLRDVLGAGQWAGAEETLDALDIVTTLPVKYTYSESVIESVSTDEELRADIGRDPLPEIKKDETPPLTDAQKNLAGSVGGQSSIDAMLELLSKSLTTRESCIARLKTFYGLSDESAQSVVPLPNEQVNVLPGTQV